MEKVAAANMNILHTTVHNLSEPGKLQALDHCTSESAKGCADRAGAMAAAAWRGLAAMMILQFATIQAMNLEHPGAPHAEAESQRSADLTIRLKTNEEHDRDEVAFMHRQPPWRRTTSRPPEEGSCQEVGPMQEGQLATSSTRVLGAPEQVGGSAERTTNTASGTDEMPEILHGENGSYGTRARTRSSHRVRGSNGNVYYLTSKFKDEINRFIFCCLLLK